MIKAVWDSMYQQYGNVIENIKKSFELHVHSGATVHKFNNMIGLVYSGLDATNREYANCGSSLSEEFLARQKKFHERLNRLAEFVGSLQ